MQAKKVKISQVKPNPNNPRKIGELEMSNLVQSIKAFPEMLELRPIIVDKDMVVLGGNMRLQACKKLKLKQVPIIIADELTDEQKKEFVIKDNVPFGKWDWDVLSDEWDKEMLMEWGLPSYEFDAGIDPDEWEGMPDFEPKENPYKLTIIAETEEELTEFVNKYKLQINNKSNKKAWYIYYPFRENDDVKNVKYE